MRLIAELSMPGNNSWNGKWSGEGETFTKVFKHNIKEKDMKFIGDYSYSFGDGWRANVEIRESKPRERVTNKFCGYDWMLNSILEHGEIKVD